MTVTTRNAVDADELAKVFNSQRSKAIEAGATVYAVGRQVDRHVVTIVEGMSLNPALNVLALRCRISVGELVLKVADILQQYDNASGFHRLHSPSEEEKGSDYHEPRAKVGALKVLFFFSP